MNLNLKYLLPAVLLPLVAAHAVDFSMGSMALPSHSAAYTIEQRNAHFEKFIEWGTTNHKNDTKYEYAYQTVMEFWYSEREEHKEIVLSTLEIVFQNKNHPKHKIISEILSDYRHPDELADELVKYNAYLPAHLHARRLKEGETIPYVKIDRTGRKWW